MYNAELLKGTLQTLLLKLLADNGRMYGYEITQKVKALTAGQIQLTEGALYPALHKLVDEGLLTTELELVSNRQRKYYHLSPAGQVAVQEKVQELQAFYATLQLVLQPQNPSTHGAD